MKKLILIEEIDGRMHTKIEGMSTVEMLGHAARLKMIATKHVLEEMECYEDCDCKDKKEKEKDDNNA